MRMTESFTREGYVIEASDFYDYTALITVYDTKGQHRDKKSYRN